MVYATGTCKNCKRTLKVWRRQDSEIGICSTCTKKTNKCNKCGKPCFNHKCWKCYREKGSSVSRRRQKLRFKRERS